MCYKIKIYVFFLILAPKLSFAAPLPNVVATASMIADMAQRVAGDRLRVACIVPIGGDPHIYEPTPRDVRLVANADLILKNGLTFEGWLNELIENSGGKAHITTVTDGIEALRSERFHNAADPHAWMSARNALTYIKNIRNALIETDKAGEAIYEKNYAAYKKELETLDDYVRQKINAIPASKRVLITSHDAFEYYGREYGIRLESVLGISTEADVQVSDMLRLGKTIRETGIRAIFIETTINPKLLRQIAADNRVSIGGKLYADSIGDADSPAPSYVALVRQNTDLIFEALTSKVTVVEAAIGQGFSMPFLLMAVGFCLVSFFRTYKKLFF